MSESIFGYRPPKFVYDSGGENETTVELDYWKLSNNGPENSEYIQESELEANREIIDRGEYWSFEGSVHLFKYQTMSAIRSKFEEIYQFNKKKVILWRYRDGQPFKDKSGNNVLFYMTVTPKHLTTMDYRDVLVISFRSLKGVDFSDSSSIIPQISEIVMSNDL